MNGNPIFDSKNQAQAWGTKQSQNPVGFQNAPQMSASQLEDMYRQPSATGADTGG
ncbi:hypothetical protein [Arthrobacter sp. JCM 19049]|uniref:hypothetical protein n=1 Tax=Arthrobacter sp. JCM 19049 TaxID=1460643 RepID=UPI000A7065AA|nr:hypothetical protein [Arthrobacter sp. JCM 19049]